MYIKVFLLIFSLWAQCYPALLVSNASFSRAKLLKNNRVLIKAAQANKKLAAQLKWDFAGTTQSGWYIYIPIISQTIGSEASIDTPQFAAALAAWQQQQNLSISGILDEESWQRMVSLLQENRLKSRDYPPLEELITVSAKEFFDPERPQELRQVHQKAYVAYKRMIAAAYLDTKVAEAMADKDNWEAQSYFKIISAWRSREYQEELRKRQGNPSRIALAKFSPHFTGRALDIYVGGIAVSTENSNRAKQVNSPAYQWLVRHAAEYGFRPYFYEPWHWEYVSETAWQSREGLSKTD